MQIMKGPVPLPVKLEGRNEDGNNTSFEGDTPDTLPLIC